MIIRPVVAKFIHADGRTDKGRQDEADNCFSQCCEHAPKPLRLARRIHLYAFYVSHETQRVLPYTTLSHWFSQEAMCLLRGTS